jgi:thymidylate kinase
VHYDLVLGQQHVKDYRLPIEQQVLDSVIRLGGVPIPAPRIELVILAVRAVLKYRLRDALKDLLGIRSPGIPAHIRQEAAWLLQRTSRAEVDDTLHALGPMVPAGLVNEIIELLTSPRVRGVRILVARERMRRALRSMQRLPRWRATARYLTAMGRRQARAAGISSKRRMTLRSGGTSIAFVGSDGAGKTTVVTAVEDWLSARLDAGSYYMGIPEPTGVLWVLKRASRAARAAHRRVTASQGTTGPVAATTRALSQATLGVRRVVEAGSRVRRSRQAERRVERGGVSLFDRYPLPSVAVFGRAMDGARLEEELEKPWNPIATRLMRWERARYDRIPEPRHIVALNVSAAESQRRKPDHDPDSIVAKTAAIRTSAVDGTAMAVVDADRDIDEVLADVKARIWTWL